MSEMTALISVWKIAKIQTQAGNRLLLHQDKIAFFFFYTFSFLPLFAFCPQAENEVVVPEFSLQSAGTVAVEVYVNTCSQTLFFSYIFQHTHLPPFQPHIYKSLYFLTHTHSLYPNF